MPSPLSKLLHYLRFCHHCKTFIKSISLTFDTLTLLTILHFLSFKPFLRNPKNQLFTMVDSQKQQKGHQQQQQSIQNQEQQGQQKEGLQGLTLSIPINELEVLYELIVDFDNIKENMFDLTKWLKSQGYEEFFNFLKEPVYPALFKQFGIHVVASKLQITSYILGHKISISEKSIEKLINHDGSGKRCFNMLVKRAKLDEIAAVIFQNGKNSLNAKNLHNHLKVWFKILLVCVHHRPSTNSFDYINTNKKYILLYLSSGTKMNLPSIMFNYLRELVKETRDGSPKPKK